MNNPNEKAIAEIKEYVQQIQDTVRDSGIPRKDCKRYVLNACGELEKQISNITAAPEDMDVETLKKCTWVAATTVGDYTTDTSYMEQFATGYNSGINFAIDHLAASGYLKTPSPPPVADLAAKVTKLKEDAFINYAARVLAPDESKAAYEGAVAALDAVLALIGKAGE